MKQGLPRERIAAASAKGRELLLPKLEEDRANFRRHLVDCAERLRGDNPPEGSEATQEQLEATLKEQLASETAPVRKDLYAEVEVLRGTIARLETAKGDELRILVNTQDASLGRVKARIEEVADMLDARQVLGDDSASDQGWLRSYLESSSTLVSDALQSAPQTSSD